MASCQLRGPEKCLCSGTLPYLLAVKCPPHLERPSVIKLPSSTTVQESKSFSTTSNGQKHSIQDSSRNLIYVKNVAATVANTIPQLPIQLPSAMYPSKLRSILILPAPFVGNPELEEPDPTGDPELEEPDPTGDPELEGAEPAAATEDEMSSPLAAIVIPAFSATAAALAVGASSVVAVDTHQKTIIDRKSGLTWECMSILRLCYRLGK
ncbi:hypothetical protein BDP27DRAFT_328914 [Rhodocollybia butyracea]|uniref:Uncharacterized protein n=1 Tax=Rhodocollybia butyracea TaxID=206335 RepID=A0A9P5Q4C4_9AGAR|nr:hypothetical protein BDP27DRAFT_328914 [Rhodocollybia butyracea]